jgi:hypothetical protein
MRRRRLLAAGVLFLGCAAVACTTGTTPDCSDAQCGTVIAADDGGDGGDVTRSKDAASDGLVEAADGF